MMYNMASWAESRPSEAGALPTLTTPAAQASRPRGLRRATLGRWLVWVLCLALIAPFRLGQWVTPARAAGVQVSAFYTVSADDAFQFSHNRGGVPPAPSNTRTFPHQVASLYFYYAYSGASVGGTRFQVILYDDSGNVLTQDNAYSAAHTAGQFMNSFSSFSDGVYRMVLYVDGTVSRSTVFTVGIGVGIVSFDTISRAAYLAWGANQGPPARTVAFPPGTPRVCFYMGYQDTTPGTAYTVTMYDHTGAVQGTDNSSFAATAGYDDACFTSSPPLLPGQYYLGLQIDGSTIAITNFSINPGSVVITAFYTLQAGTSSFTHAPRRAERYPAGTKLINYYFHFHGIAPDRLNYSITLEVPNGVHSVSLENSGSSLGFDNTANSGSVLNSVAVRRPFPSGDYQLDLVVNGATLASTTFTIATG